MSKFCTNCGATMDDNATFCTACGAKNEVSKPASNPNVYQANTGSAAAASGDTPLDQLKAKSSQAISDFKNNPKKNTYIGIAVVAVAVVVIIILLVSLLGGGYKGAVGDYLDAICDKDGEAYLEATTPDKLIKYLDKEADFDEKDQVKAAKSTAKSKYDKLTDEFGKDLDIDFKIVDKEKADKDDIEDLNDLLDTMLEDAKLKVSAAYELELELTIKGKDDEEEEIEASCTVVKMNGDWVVMSFTCKDYKALNSSSLDFTYNMSVDDLYDLYS